MFMRCFLEIKFADIRLISLEHVTINVYLNLSKAVDTIDHSTLQKKL